MNYSASFDVTKVTKLSLSETIKNLDDKRCRVCVFYERLSKADREAFDKWLADGKPLADLCRACMANGLDFSGRQAQSAFRHHVRSHHVSR